MPFSPYGPGCCGGWGWMMMAGGWIVMLVFLGLIVAGTVLLVRALANRPTAGRPGSDSALEVLRRRYAAGEITKEQFEEMKRTLV